MRSVVCVSVCVCVCWAHTWAVLKRLNRSRCRLGVVSRWRKELFNTWGSIKDRPLTTGGKAVSHWSYKVAWSGTPVVPWWSHHAFAINADTVVKEAQTTTAKKTIVLFADDASSHVDRLASSTVDEEQIVATAYLQQVEDQRRDQDSVQMNVLVLQNVLQNVYTESASHRNQYNISLVTYYSVRRLPTGPELSRSFTV